MLKKKKKNTVKTLSYVIQQLHLKKLVSCFCPCNKATCFLLCLDFRLMAFFFKLFLSLVSFANKILFADGFVNFSSSHCTAVSLDGTVMFSFSPRDSFSVLFLLRHFGVPSALCSLVLISCDDFMSLLANGLGPVLMLTPGLAHAMSPYTFLLPSNGFYDKYF